MAWHGPVENTDLVYDKSVPQNTCRLTLWVGECRNAGLQITLQVPRNKLPATKAQLDKCSRKRQALQDQIKATEAKLAAVQQEEIRLKQELEVDIKHKVARLESLLPQLLRAYIDVDSQDIGQLEQHLKQVFEEAQRQRKDPQWSS